MLATIFTSISSGSKIWPCEGSMLTRTSLGVSPMGMSACGVEDCVLAGAGDTVEHPVHLNEGTLWPLSSNKPVTLMSVDSWLPNDVFSMNMLRGRNLLTLLTTVLVVDSVVAGSQVHPAACTIGTCSCLAAEEELAAVEEVAAGEDLSAVEELAGVVELADVEDLADMWELADVED